MLLLEKSGFSFSERRGVSFFRKERSVLLSEKGTVCRFEKREGCFVLRQRKGCFRFKKRRRGASFLEKGRKGRVFLFSERGRGVSG